MKKCRLLPIGTLSGATCAASTFLITFVVYAVLSVQFSDLLSKISDRSWLFLYGVLAGFLASSIVTFVGFSIISIAAIYPALRLMDRLEAHGGTSAVWAYTIAGMVAGALLAVFLLLIVFVFVGPLRTPERWVAIFSVIFSMSTIAAWAVRRRHARKVEKRIADVFAP